MMVIGLCFRGMAITTVSLQLPQIAAMISTSNQDRTRVAGDLLALGWAVCPLVQGLGFLNALSLQSQMNIFSLIDVVTKLGATHLMLKRQTLQRASRVRNALGDAEGPDLEVIDPLEGCRRLREVVCRAFGAPPDATCSA